MIRKVLKQVNETYCDVCGEKCYSYSTHRLTTGEEYHACSKYHDDINKTCMNILDEGLINKNFTSKVPLLDENMLDVTVMPKIADIIESLSNEAPLDFMGTGSISSAKIEEREWEENKKIAIDALTKLFKSNFTA